MNLDKIPSMKDLNTRYLKMSPIMHPDKNGGSKEVTEEYQKLQNFYRASIELQNFYWRAYCI